MNQSDNDYSEIVNSLAKTNPVTGSLLRDAQQRRKANLQQYLNGVRLRGFEELIEYLDTVHPVYLNQPELSNVAFLIRRAKGAFVTALEAALSGFNSVAHDSMRTVMEIEFLLRDFALEPSRIDRWLTSTPSQLYDFFRPAVLRRRFAQHLGISAKDLAEATDYKGHSIYLHVGPRANPFDTADLSDGTGPFGTDSCFWEIFEHSRRLLIALEALADRIEPGSFRQYNPENLERLGEAWLRTQEMQQIWQQLVGAVVDPNTEDPD